MFFFNVEHVKHVNDLFINYRDGYYNCFNQFSRIDYDAFSCLYDYTSFIKNQFHDEEFYDSDPGWVNGWPLGHKRNQWDGKKHKMEYIEHYLHCERVKSNVLL